MPFNFAGFFFFLLIYGFLKAFLLRASSWSSFTLPCFSSFFFWKCLADVSSPPLDDLLLKTTKNFQVNNVILGFINKSKDSKMQNVILPCSALGFTGQGGFRSVLLKPEKSNKEGLEVKKLQPMRKRLKELLLFDQEKEKLKTDKLTNFKYGTIA